MNRNEEFASEMGESIKTTYGSESASRTGTSILILHSSLNDDVDGDLWFLSFENETECESNFWNCIQKMKKNQRHEKLWELGTGTWKKNWFYVKFRCKDVSKLKFKLQKTFWIWNLTIKKNVQENVKKNMHLKSQRKFNLS